MVDKITEASLLYDFYGQLLTEKQQKVMELYHEENLSLAEIASEFDITRSAVYDTLKKAEKALNQYENKLCLISKFMKTNQVISKIDNKIDEIINKNKENKGFVCELEDIKIVIGQLEE